MKTLFQSRVQQHLEKHSLKQRLPSVPESHRGSIVVAPAFTQSEHALVIVDRNRCLFAANPSAVSLLGCALESSKGEPLDNVGGGILAAIALHPGAALATVIFELPDGRTLLAKTRPLTGRNRCSLGWIVLLQDISRLTGEFTLSWMDTQRVLSTLQTHVQTLQELITMMPQFSQHQYWRHLLAEHMGRITDEMTAQLQQIMPISA